MATMARTVSGVVRKFGTGEPIPGVMVIGSNLNWVETDDAGRYTLKMPDMAVFFWCSGFLPVSRVVGAERLDIDLRKA